jgi:hypothetical protein
MGASGAPSLHDSGFGGFVTPIYNSLAVVGIWGSSLHHRSVPVFWLHLGECVCSNLSIRNNLEFQGVPGIGAEILSTTVVTAIAINFRSSSAQ